MTKKKTKRTPASASPMSAGVEGAPEMADTEPPPEASDLEAERVAEGLRDGSGSPPNPAPSGEGEGGASSSVASSSPRRNGAPRRRVERAFGEAAAEIPLDCPILGIELDVGPRVDASAFPTCVGGEWISTLAFELTQHDPAHLDAAAAWLRRNG